MSTTNLIFLIGGAVVFLAGCAYFAFFYKPAKRQQEVQTTTPNNVPANSFIGTLVNGYMTVYYYTGSEFLYVTEAVWNKLGNPTFYYGYSDAINATIPLPADAKPYNS